MGSLFANGGSLNSYQRKVGALFFEHSLIPLFASYCRQSHDFSFITPQHVDLLCKCVRVYHSLSQQAILFLSLYVSHKGLSVLPPTMTKELLVKRAAQNEVIAPHLLLLLTQMMEPTEDSFSYFCDQYLRAWKYPSTIPICLKAIKDCCCIASFSCVVLSRITDDEINRKINRKMQELIRKKRVVDKYALFRILRCNPVFFSNTIMQLTQFEDELLVRDLRIDYCELVIPFSRRANEFFVFLLAQYLQLALSSDTLILSKRYALILKYIASKNVVIEGDQLFLALDKLIDSQGWSQAQNARERPALSEKQKKVKSIWVMKLMDAVVMVLQHDVGRLRITNRNHIVKVCRVLLEFIGTIDGTFVVLNEVVSCMPWFPALISRLASDRGRRLRSRGSESADRERCHRAEDSRREEGAQRAVAHRVHRDHGDQRVRLVAEQRGGEVDEDGVAAGVQVPRGGGEAEAGRIQPLRVDRGARAAQGLLVGAVLAVSLLGWSRVRCWPSMPSLATRAPSCSTRSSRRSSCP